MQGRIVYTPGLNDVLLVIHEIMTPETRAALVTVAGVVGWVWISRFRQA